MPLSLYCVLLAGLMPVIIVGIAKAQGQYDNRQPRLWAARTEGLAARAYAAHLNAYENFPFFAAAVLVAVTQGGPVRAVNAMAAAFVLARIGHAAAYVLDRPNARSVAWIAGWLLTIAIFLSPAFG